MCAEENRDLDAMLNDPFRHLGKKPPTETEAVRLPEPEERERESLSIDLSEGDRARMERNHPMELRMLAFEKNEYNMRRKIEDIKRIIEHQNERIRLLEEELERLREKGK